MKRVIATFSLAALLAGGCTSYYKVTDPTTGKVYYTTDLQHKDSGAATLKDARTGNKVALQNSEVEKITKEQYEGNRFNAPEAPATPAAPKAPQSAAPAAAPTQDASANPFK
jgi:hypothetical protein